jgi:hypothetical protein
MAVLLEALCRPGAVWIDWLAYGRRLLLEGRDVPWLRPAEAADFYGRLQRFLTSAAVAVPLAPIFATWLAENPAALAEAKGKRRVGAALKVLLALEAPRAAARELVAAVQGSVRVPLALAVPEPGAWAATVHATLNGESLPTVDDDLSDSAGVTVADALRAFAECPVAGVIVEGESPGLDPLRNLAAHYRWDVGIRGDEAIAIGGLAVPFVEIPAETIPERALELVASFRRG